ncbi:MAG TPA: hypothetical protein VNL38_02930 [Candidatus Nitrosotenuis sp.]|nr:hypothetical protein [Candidatus Nitrosotenuis sp.]
MPPLILVLLAGLTGGCAKSKKTVVPPTVVKPALESTAPELTEKFNQLARAVRSVNAGVELNPVAGSAYSGVIEDYHDVRGFILAQRPSSIRVLGQAPVIGKNIFDMVSDGETFRIFIPSKNKFLVGPTNLERPAKKPIENLRPQHLLDAMFWPELDASSTVLFEEFDASAARFYILTELRSAGAPEIARKIWFERSDLSLARIQLYGPRGRLQADISYGDWLSAGAGLPAYPRHIRVARPHDDYQLEIRIHKLTLNEEISAERFRLEQPAGSELVNVNEKQGTPQP